MTLSTNQKIILWVTVLLVAMFVGSGYLIKSYKSQFSRKSMTIDEIKAEIGYKGKLSSIEQESETSAIEMMEAVFQGGYSKAQIKKRLDKVMSLYNIPTTERNYHKCGSCLVSLRKEYGVEEMKILDFMLQVGATKAEFPEGATVAVFMLESQEQ